MKKLTIIAVLLLLVGCAATRNLPSVCDGITEKSLLCELSHDKGVRLEDIGTMLIVVNAVAIGDGLYTRGQAIAVLIEIRAAIDNPVSYMFFRNYLEDTVAKYPGLLEIADIYLAGFNTPQTMYATDQDILRNWLDKRIAVMKALE